MPDAIVDQINRDSLRALRTQEFQAVLARNGMTLIPVEKSPSEFAAFLAEDFARWKGIVRQARIKAE